ncbi:MAG TPA: hypothetical protein VE912_22900 [Bacteroidales bacterium]|nr:hypothetical protein [Bacteroidales bacterium]
MQVLDLSYAQAEKHLGILVVDTLVDCMVDRFEEGERDQVGRMHMDVAVDNGVTKGDTDLLPGIEGIDIGRHEFWMTHRLTVIYREEVFIGAVGDHRAQPRMKITEVQPADRVQLQADHGKRRRMSREDILPVVALAPNRNILPDTQRAPLPFPCQSATKLPITGSSAVVGK